MPVPSSRPAFALCAIATSASTWSADKKVSLFAPAIRIIAQSNGGEPPTKSDVQRAAAAVSGLDGELADSLATTIFDKYIFAQAGARIDLSKLPVVANEIIDRVEKNSDKNNDGILSATELAAKPLFNSLVLRAGAAALETTKLAALAALPNGNIDASRSHILSAAECATVAQFPALKNIEQGALRGDLKKGFSAEFGMNYTFAPAEYFAVHASETDATIVGYGLSMLGTAVAADGTPDKQHLARYVRVFDLAGLSLVNHRSAFLAAAA
ncbi:hypothetical protein DAPPUDRAFT_280574, partial [Daphnia pulex]